MMQLPQHLHAGGHLLRVLCIRIPSALIILGDLVAGFSVKIQNMFGNAKRCDRLVNSLLLFPVNQKFCSRTRNAADIMFSIQFKQERLVCHTRFETADVVYRFLFYIENVCDQLHGGIVRMILIFRIKQAQFFQVFKLIDLIRRLAVHRKIQFFDMIDDNLFPVPLFCARLMIGFLNERNQLVGKITREERRSIHDPGIMPTDLHRCDTSLFIRRKTPL